MNKKVIAGGVLALGSLYFLTTGSSNEVVEPVVAKKEAPEGYLYNRDNKLIPVVEAKTLLNQQSFFNDMRAGVKKGLDNYGLGLAQELNNIRVRENVISGKPTVRFIDENATGTSKNVELVPPGLLSGLVYTGRSNLNRKKLDELAYGAISEWLGTEDPSEIGVKYFGEGFDNFYGFKLALLDFQRQLVVSKYQLNTVGFPYQSVAEEYVRIQNTYIEKDIVPPDEDLKVFEGVVMNNVKNLANFSGVHLKKMHKSQADEVALMLIEFFIYDDIKLLNSLKTNIKLVKPAPTENKLERRIQREQDEIKARERELEEQRRQELLNKRLGRGS